MGMTSWNEEEWLRYFRQESSRHQAFQALMQVFHPILYSQIKRLVLNHEDTQDVLQETFIKAWLHLPEFRGSARISTWLYRIAHNESLNFLNKASRKQSWKDTYSDLPASGGFTAEEGDELAQKFLLAIETLPPRQKAVFCYRYYDELSYENIAEITGISTGALKASYHHAAGKIEKYLTGH